MEFLIADTFTASLARLTGDEQKAAKMTAFDLQLNPTSSALNFHRLDKAKDKGFHSVRVNGDIRIIVHKSNGSLLLCYVDHHDKAYKWGESRKLETHPATGAAQLVEIRETVEDVVLPRYVAAPVQPLFAAQSDENLMSFGVPVEWLADVREATEATLLELTDHLPGEAAEALLELATGGRPQAATRRPQSANPFAHPDAQRRFRVMNDVKELERALDFPWDKWTVFLHPDQQRWVEQEYNGPARVSGSAGTGKTIVALHRAVHLAGANPDARVLLTTFSPILANALQNKLNRLVSNQPQLAERIDVRSMDEMGARLYKLNFGEFQLATRAQIIAELKIAAAAVEDHKFSASFLLDEWEQVADAWQLTTWAGYRDVPRLGRKTRLPEVGRQKLWEIFAALRAALAAKGLITASEMFGRLTTEMEGRDNLPYDFVVVDEAQDASIPQIRFFAALNRRADALFFAGDLGQRIFQQPFSWRGLGIDVRGRSRTLRVNYRTSHQIRMQADLLLGKEVADADGNTEERGGTVSVFNGPAPQIKVLESEDEEIEFVASWIAECAAAPEEFGVFVRSDAEIPRARAAVEKAGLPFKVLDDYVETIADHVSISTMHLAKGLEFRAVVVMACDDEIVPLQARIESVGDNADLKEVYETERHLLYVACTRARDFLLVTSVDPASEFLDDLQV